MSKLCFVSKLPHVTETFSCFVKELMPFLPWWQCINIDSFGVIICYNLVTGKMQQQFYSLFSQNENWAKLSVPFELYCTSWQPMNQFGWNVAKVLPDTLVVILKTMCTNFDFFFSFLRCIFSTGNANDLSFLTSSAYNKKRKHFQHFQEPYTHPILPHCFHFLSQT